MNQYFKKKVFLFRKILFHINRFFLLKLLFISTLSFSTIAAIGQNRTTAKRQPFIIQRINSPIKLNGLSNEAVWQLINPFPLRTVVTDYDTEPSMRTEIRMCYDDDYVYVSGRFHYKNSKSIRAVSLQRDYWYWNTDLLVILLDTYQDNENGVVFATTPAGTRTDINVMDDFNRWNKSWNTFWDAKTVIKDSVWFSELRIPFSSLRYKEKNGQVRMGLLVHRYLAENSKTYVFPLIPEEYATVMGGYRPSLTQEVIFEGIKTHNPFYITPYLLTGAGQSQKLNNAGTKYEPGNNWVKEVGLDVKYGLSKNLTLDITINPDFAQAEADDQQINLTRFSLFFPEKRLFFQERQGNFDFNFEEFNKLFYSRRIGLYEGNQVRIYGGARIVGRAGDWDIGFLNMQTQKFDPLPSENFNVLRLRKQVINPYSYVGGIFTSRIGNSMNWNTTYGLDAIFRLFGYDYLSIKWAQSFENDRENLAFSLEPSKIYINWNRRGNQGLGYDLSFSRSGIDYNPGIGYERRENYTRYGDRIKYEWMPGSDSKLRRHFVFFDGKAYTQNTKKEIESYQFALGWQFTTNEKNSEGNFSVVHYKENLKKEFKISEDTNVPAGKYSFYSFKGEYSPNRSNPYRIQTTFEVGSFYDGNKVSFNLNPNAIFSKYVQLDCSYQMDFIKFPERNQEFTGHIAKIKLSTYLNTKLSLVSMGQYNSAANKIFTNIRFRFNPKEGHDLYVVYNDELNTNRTRNIPELPTSNNRTILLKYNYTFKIGL